MKFTIIYTKTAFSDIQKLDSILQKKLKKKIELYMGNPLSYSTKLVNSSIGTYRWRVGNYRIIFDIDRNKIIVLRVGHRREIYR